MRWEMGRGGGGVEDRRGMGGGTLAGGAGVEEQGKLGTPQDRAGRFVDVVAANIGDVWSAKLRATSSPASCSTNRERGRAAASANRRWCRSIVRTTRRSIWTWASGRRWKRGWAGADFARAHVVAHEFGHHVQTLMGTTKKVEQAQARALGAAEANRYSVALELQADCYAGVWAKNAAAASNGEVALESGDLEEGLKTANAIGDDTLQRKTASRRRLEFRGGGEKRWASIGRRHNILLGGAGWHLVNPFYGARLALASPVRKQGCQGE